MDVWKGEWREGRLVGFMTWRHTPTHTQQNQDARKGKRGVLVVTCFFLL